MNLGGNVLNNVQSSSSPGSVRNYDGYGGDNEVLGDVVRPRFRGNYFYESFISIFCYLIEIKFSDKWF